MKTILITGATGGLGLRITRELSKNPDIRPVMLVRDTARGEQAARALPGKADVRKLDLSSLLETARFAAEWDAPIHGLIHNAGTQNVDAVRFTSDGFEETIAVNHLAPLLLTLSLRSRLKNGRVLFIGSGTHNPDYPTAGMFGFRGASEKPLSELITGRTGAETPEQTNRDLYATSKFFNTVTAVELAARYEDFTSSVLDPGLMPGTGLARGQSKRIQFAWNYLMPVFGLFLPDTTTPRRSGRTAAWMVSADAWAGQTGQVLSFDRKPSRHLDRRRVENTDLRQQLFDDSVELIRPYLL